METTREKYKNIVFKTRNKSTLLEAYGKKKKTKQKTCLLEKAV